MKLIKELSMHMIGSANICPQVKTISFYDVVMDFILMDAFDDLENPPSSVTAVVNNRWLSNGFKETVRLAQCSASLSFGGDVLC